MTEDPAHEARLVADKKRIAFGSEGITPVVVAGQQREPDQKIGDRRQSARGGAGRLRQFGERQWLLFQDVENTVVDRRLDSEWRCKGPDEL